MTTWLVTRYSGAVEWMRRRGLVVDRPVEHLDPALVAAGDRVLGSLPVNLAAEVCGRGAHYLHLALEVPPALRGRELSADEMEHLDARLIGYSVERVAEEG